MSIKDKSHLWFSETQLQHLLEDDNLRKPCYGKLEDGRVVQYTEARISNDKPPFDDVIYLGVGEWYGHWPE